MKKLQSIDDFKAQMPNEVEPLNLSFLLGGANTTKDNCTYDADTCVGSTTASCEAGAADDTGGNEDNVKN
jgi:hypothetical protein